jgi:hypothetical protein
MLFFSLPFDDDVLVGIKNGSHGSIVNLGWCNVQPKRRIW